MKYENDQDYLVRCKGKPGWVKDKDDAIKYAAHIAHRLYQAKERIEVYEKELQRIHPKVYEEAYDKAEKASEELEKIWNADENHSNFTDWTPTQSYGELYPKLFAKTGTE